MLYQFEVITSSGDKGILYNSTKKRDEILEVKSGCILKDLRGLNAKQEDKRLYRGARSQIRRSEK